MIAIAIISLKTGKIDFNFFIYIFSYFLFIIQLLFCDVIFLRKFILNNIWLKIFPCKKTDNVIYMYITGVYDMLALRLPNEIETRLDALAKATGRTKTYYAREAIVTHLEDLEDTYLALQRLEKNNRRWTMEEVEAGLDLAN
jgi:RHH-type rel operon transcriptional repressor/antitoxin RelB